MTKENKKQDFEKGEKVKKIIQTIFDITIFALLLFYLIHIKFGVGMQKINIEVTTNCEGTITNINGLPENQTFNTTELQKTIYEEYNKQRGVTTWNYSRKKKKTK